MREQNVILAFCLLVAAGSVGIAAWVALSGEARAGGIDALFLILVCLLMAAAFAFPPLLAFRQGQFRGLFKRHAGDAPKAEEASKAVSGTPEKAG